MKDHSRFETAALVFAILLPTAVTLVYFVVLSPFPAAVQQASYLAGKVLQFAFPVIWVYVVRREPFLFRRPNWLGVASGFGLGLLIFVVMVGAYFAWLKPAGFFDAPAVAVRATVKDLGIGSPLKYIATGVFYALCHSLLEEYYWRWFVFWRLEKRSSLTFAVAISSLGFMMHHIILLGQYFTWHSPATYLFSLAVAAGGVLWALLYHWSRSLTGSWVSHLLVDAGIFLIGFDLVWG